MEAVLGAAANSSFIDKFYGSKKNNNHGTTEYEAIEEIIESLKEDGYDPYGTETVRCVRVATLSSTIIVHPYHPYYQQIDCILAGLMLFVSLSIVYICLRKYLTGEGPKR